MKNLKRIFSPLFRQKYWPIVLLFAVILLFYWRTLLQGRVPFPGDFVVGVYYPWLDYDWGFPSGVPVKNPILADVPSFIYPMQKLAVDLLKSGQLPLWNPYILAGTPLLANFQSAPFSPTNFVYLFIDFLSGWSIQVFLQHFFAAFFTYLLLREWNVTKLGSLVGGVVFAMSGFNMIWSLWNGHALSAAFIPLLLYFQHKYFTQGSSGSLVGTSVAIFLQILSGYPQILLYSLIAMGLYWLMFLRFQKQFLVETLTYSVFCGLGFGLAAFQLLPGAELLAFSQREIEPHPYAWAFLPWSKVITFIAPDYFGNHATGNYWGPQDYTSNTGFVGAVGLFVGLIGISHFRKVPQVRYAVVLSLVSLVFSFPTFISVGIWKWGIAGMQAASAHRALVLWCLGMSFAVGFGVDALLERRLKKLSLLSVIPHLVLLFAVIITLHLLDELRAYPFLYYTRGIPKFEVALRNLIFPLGMLGIATVLFYFRNRGRRMGIIATFFVCLLIVVEVFRFGWKYTPFVSEDLIFPKTPVIQNLVTRQERALMSSVIPVNLHMPYGIKSIEGYDAVYPLRMAKYIAVAGSNDPEAEPQGRYSIVSENKSRLIDIAGVSAILSMKDQGIAEDSVLFSDGSVQILKNEGALPRVKLFYDWNVVGEDEVLDTLLETSFNYQSMLLIEERVDFEKEGGSGEASIIKDNPLEMEVTVSTQGNALLYIADSYYPGWRAYVDGGETRIICANYAFRAVPVSPGEHRVRLVYRPDSFYNGIKASLLSVVSMSLIFLIYRKHFNVKKRFIKQ